MPYSFLSFHYTETGLKSSLDSGGILHSARNQSIIWISTVVTLYFHVKVALLDFHPSKTVEYIKMSFCLTKKVSSLFCIEMIKYNVDFKEGHENLLTDCQKVSSTRWEKCLDKQETPQHLLRWDPVPGEISPFYLLCSHMCAWWTLQDSNSPLLRGSSSR